MLKAILAAIAGPLFTKLVSLITNFFREVKQQRKLKRYVKKIEKKHKPLKKQVEKLEKQVENKEPVKKKKRREILKDVSKL